MTAHADHDDALRAAEAGAAGFILKEVRIAKVVAAVRRAVAGEPAIDPTVLHSILIQAAGEGRPEPSPVPELPPLEGRLARLLAGGADRRTAARALELQDGDVVKLTESLQERLGARSVLEALVRAARGGLLQAEPPTC